MENEPRSVAREASWVSQENPPSLWRRIIRWSAILAAVMSLAIGLLTTFRSGTPREYPWRSSLSGVTSAPIPVGSVVVLTPPAESVWREQMFLAFEVRWLRPDLFWCVSGQKVGEAAEFGVGIKPYALPAGWSILTEDEDIVVVSRNAGTTAK